MLNNLKDIVLNQKLEKEELLTRSYIIRTQEPFAKKWLDTELIKVVLGPRRAGKSIFSLMLLKDRPFMYFNFDDEVLFGMSGVVTHELMKELHAQYGDIKTVLFDEIQNLHGWELFANRLHREGYNIILTGSNAHLLSKELATHLTGRHMPIEILPFNFNEFMRAKNFTVHPEYGSLPEYKGRLLKLIEEYLVSGGFPDVVIKNMDPRDYLEVLFDALLFKDVIKRHRVKFSTQVSKLGTHLINNFSSLYTVNKIQKILNFKSVTTTDKYINYLEEAYLIFSLHQYSYKSIERLKSPRKVYIIDNGFINAKAIQHSPNKGKLMENLIFTELVKRGVKPNRHLFYYKTRNDKEVDFLIKNDLAVIELIQVCYDITNIDTEEREIKALVEAAGELEVTKLTLLTWDEKREVKKKGMTIQLVPLWEWLTINTKVK